MEKERGAQQMLDSSAGSCASPPSARYLTLQKKIRPNPAPISKLLRLLLRQLTRRLEPTFKPCSEFCFVYTNVLVLGRQERVDATEITVLLVDIQSVADYEFVRYFEAYVKRGSTAECKRTLWDIL